MLIQDSEYPEEIGFKKGITKKISQKKDKLQFATLVLNILNTQLRKILSELTVLLLDTLLLL